MLISVVVPAFNEEKLLPETLRQIKAACAAFAPHGWFYELVVCDNNSSDRTAEVARAEGAKVVFEPVNQIARARNTGAKAAAGEWLIFVDADSHPSRELLAAVAREIQGGRCLAGGSTVSLATNARFALLGVRLWNWLSRTFKWVAGSFIFCEAGVFRELGGFNETLFASEEIEFSKRLKPLARRRRRAVVILTDHPLVTSGRKLHLYTAREFGQFFRRAIFSHGKSLTRRDSCALWYDGRR